MATSAAAEVPLPASAFTRSVDVYIPIEAGTSKHVHLQLLEGDITTEDTQAVVVFRSYNDTAEGDSLRVLQAAGDGIEAEYQNAKAQGGRHVRKGVVLTGAGNLVHPRHILHLRLDGNHKDSSYNNTANLREMFVTALRLTDKRELKSLALPPLPHGSSEEAIKIMLESVEEFTRNDRPICLHFIQIVIKSKDSFTQYLEARQEIEFELYKCFMLHNSITMTINSYSSKTESTIVLSYRRMNYPPEIHVRVGQVSIHVKTTEGHYLNEDDALAFVNFKHLNEERQERNISKETLSNLDTEATVLSSNITVKTVGQQRSRFEISINDDPGKFPRVRTAIQTMLRLADQRGITHVILPSKFHYGDDQIECNCRCEILSYRIPYSTYHCEKHPEMIFPCLFLQAIHDFALYDQPSSLHTIYIYADNDDIAHYKKVKNISSFKSLQTLKIDPLFPACHLSLVKETTHDRYNYGCALQQMSAVEVPRELLLTSSDLKRMESTSVESKTSCEGTSNDHGDFMDSIDIRNYVDPESVTSAPGLVPKMYFGLKNPYHHCRTWPGARTHNVLWLEEPLPPLPPHPTTTTTSTLCQP